jgi:hypothetical protein
VQERETEKASSEALHRMVFRAKRSSIGLFLFTFCILPFAFLFFHFHIAPCSSRFATTKPKQPE